MKYSKFWESKQQVDHNELVSSNIPLNKMSRFFFWRNQIHSSKRNKVVKKFSWITIIFIAIFIALLILSLKEFDFGMGRKWVVELRNTIKNIFKFDSRSDLINGNIWGLSFDAIISTIKITVVGTMFGILLAIPTSFLSARNITKSKWVSGPIRIVMAFFRTVPPLVFAIIFASGFQPTLAATLTLMFFTWATMNKLLYEEIENTSLDSYHSLVSSGTSKIVAFKNTVLRKIAPKLTSLSIYAFEINLRISAVLGLIGSIGGIGVIMNLFTRSSEMSHLAIPLTILIVTIIIIETIFFLLRVFIFEKKGSQYDAESLNEFTSATEYKISMIKIKYEKKLKTSNRKKTIHLKKKMGNKIKKCMSNKKIASHKIINKIRDGQSISIKAKFAEKINNITAAYDKRINRRKNRENLSAVSKLEIAKKQNIANLKQMQKNQLEILNNATVASPRTLFVESKRDKYVFINILLIIVTSLLFIWGINDIEFYSLSDSKFGQNMSYLFRPSFSEFHQAFSETFSGTLVAFFSTIVGGILAFFFGMLASRKVTSIFIAPIFQLLIIIIRVIPAFVVVLIIWPLTKDPAFATVIALSVHSIGMLGKLVREQFDAVDKGPSISIKAAGGTWYDVLRFSIFPQVIPNILSVTIYRFEINIKSMIIIGVITRDASPFGFNMKNAFDLGTSGKYEEYGTAYAYLWSIIIIVLIVEFASNIIRGYILTGLLPGWVYKIIKITNKKNDVRKMLYLETKGYDVKNMTTQDIKSTFGLERQSELDYAETKFILKNEDFKKSNKLSKEIQEKINYAQFHNFKLNRDEIKQLKILRNELLRKVRASMKTESKIFKVKNKKVQMIFKKTWNDSCNKYKELSSMYKNNLQAVKNKYDQIIKNERDSFKKSKHDNSKPNEIYHHQYNLKMAKSESKFDIKAAKNKQLISFI